MKKIVMLEWTARRAIMEANRDKNPLEGKTRLHHIPIKMEVEIPDDDYEEVRRDPRLHMILQELFKEEVVKQFYRRVIPQLEKLNNDWDSISSLRKTDRRLKEIRSFIIGILPEICASAEKEMLKKIGEDVSLRQKYKHYRWKVAKQTALTSLAVGSAVAATAGAVGTAGATLPLAVVGLYRSVMSGVKLIRDCALEAETCQKHVIYGIAHVAKSYGLMEHKGDGESGRLQNLSQADMTSYSPESAKKAGNTAKELASNFFLDSVLKWPGIKKPLTSVKAIKGETELWENKLANLAFQSHDLSVKLNELLEKTDDLKSKLAENAKLVVSINLRKKDSVTDPIKLQKEEDQKRKEDKGYNKMVAKVEKEVGKLLDKGFYIPSMAKSITIAELHGRAEAGLKKVENLKPIFAALELKGLAKGTLIASGVLDIAVSVTLAVAGDTYGPVTAGTDQFNDALTFLGSNWMECFAVPQDVYATTNSLYSFAVDLCGAPTVNGEAGKVLLEE